MELHRTAGRSTAVPSLPLAGPSPHGGRVRGLGLVDTLSIELDALQLPWLLDELDTLRGVLEEHLSTQGDDLDTDERDRRHYQLKVLAMIRAQIPRALVGDGITVVGPQATMTELVHGAARNAVDALGEELRRPKPNRELYATATAAKTWTDTYVELEAVGNYSFDPEYDPIHADDLA